MSSSSPEPIEVDDDDDAPTSPSSPSKTETEKVNGSEEKTSPSPKKEEASAPSDVEMAPKEKEEEEPEADVEAATTNGKADSSVDNTKEESCDDEEDNKAGGGDALVVDVTGGENDNEDDDDESEDDIDAPADDTGISSASPSLSSAEPGPAVSNSSVPAHTVVHHPTATAIAISTGAQALTMAAARQIMLDNYTPWVMGTYGDSAKTKTITTRKYARIVALLKALEKDASTGGTGESSGSEAAKFRLWVKSKGFHLGPPLGHPDCHKPECAELLYLPTGTDKVR